MENSQTKKITVIICAIIAVFLANIVPLILLPSTRLGLDWDFESYSLVLKSAMLYYHKFPIHDPWVAGGFDILANPQCRALAPSIFLEFLFDPAYVNLSIIILWGLLGFWGSYKLLKFYNISDTSALIFSAMFLNSSYFGLHLSEGHISFASWQALGLFFYLILNIDKIKYLFFYSLLMLFILFEGHIHVLLFSQIILTICLAFNINDISRNIAKNYRSYLPRFLIITGISAMIACLKLAPALMMFAKRAPIMDYENMSLYLILKSFFDPFQHVVKDTHIFIHPLLDPRPRFHEYGCYLGIVSVVILATHIFNKKFLKENLKIILLTVFFFWIGSGWLEIINPWKIFSKIPLLNNVHIPSRLFIVVALLCIVLLAKIFDSWRDKPLRYWGLVIFLLLEAIFARNYPFYKLFDLLETRPHLTTLIKSDNIDKTLYYGKIPYHYYQHNTGAQTTYEPAKLYTPIHNSNDINYRGEIYECDEPDHKNHLEITKYIPGEIHIKYNLNKRGCIQLNTNNLLGWKVAKGNIEIVSNSPQQLLTLNTKDEHGEAVIKYRPIYLKWTLLICSLGIIFAILYWKMLMHLTPPVE